MQITKTTKVQFTGEDVRKFLIERKLISEDQEVEQIRLFRNKKSFIIDCVIVEKFEEDDLQIFPVLTEEEIEIVLNKPVDELDVSVRTLDALKRAKLYTLKDIEPLSESEIRKNRFIGKLGVMDISNSFKNFGVKWPKNIKE